MDSTDKLEELKDILMRYLDRVKQTNISVSLKKKPVYTLRGILAGRTAEDLKQLAKAVGIKDYKGMNKAELADKLYPSLSDPAYVEKALHVLTLKEWAFFNRTASQKELIDNIVTIDSFNSPLVLGLLQIFYDDDEFIYVVPEEIREIFSRMQRDGTADSVEQALYIDCYAQAAVNLYGIIPLEEFFSIIRTHYSEKPTQNDIIAVLTQRIYEDSDYCFWEQYLVHDDFEKDDFARVAMLEEASAGKHRYLPPKDIFLKYADPEYYEQTPQVQKLSDYILSRYDLDYQKTVDIVSDIMLKCAAEYPTDEILEVFKDHGVVLDSQKKLEQLLPILTEVINNTRVWSNKGHTPNEMAHGQGPNLCIIPAGKDKPGRNDPCPCGSGKKYKKCCGWNA